MKLETSPYSKKINHLSNIFIDARQTNILNFSILDVPKLRCRTKCFKTHLNVFSSVEGSLRQECRTKPPQDKTPSDKTAPDKNPSLFCMGRTKPPILIIA